MSGLLGNVAQNQRRSLRDSEEKTPKNRSIRKLKVHKTLTSLARPK
jgi:hypothetical protein